MSTQPQRLHPLVAQDVDKQHVSYDKPFADIVVNLELERDENDCFTGSAHVDGNHLCRAMGVPDADLLNLGEIEFTGANTGAGFAVGGTVFYGKGEDMEPLTSASRVHHFDDPSNATVAAHVVIPAGNDGLNTFIAPPNGLGSVKLEHNKEDVEMTRTALGRELRWGAEAGKSKGELATTCSEITSGDETRFLVPNKAAADNCAFSKLLQANEVNPAFCGGAYHPDKRSVTTNAANQECTIMTAADFKTTHSSLAQNLTTHSKAQRGLSFNVSSFGTTTAESDIVPLALHARLHRKLTRTMLAPAEDGTTLITPLARAECHELLGETAAATALPVPHTNELATRVFQAKLNDGLGGKKAPKVTEAIVIEAPGSDPLDNA
jgi:hypothetical protein